MVIILNSWGDKMGLALLKDKELNGMNRKDFEDALMHIADMARIAEQKLTLKVDKRINDSYKEKKHEIDEVSVNIRSLLK